MTKKNRLGSINSAIEAQTDHKSVFKELKARMFLDKTKDLVTVVNQNGEFLYVNSAAVNFFGVKPEELVGQKAFDFIHPEDREKTEETFNSWISQQVESASFENRQLAKDGRVIHTLWTIVPQWENGQLKEVWSIARDITDKKNSEAILKHEQARLNSVIDGIDDVVYIADPDTFELLHVNKTFEKCWGTSQAGKKCYAVLQGRDTPCPFCTNDKIFGEFLGQSYVWEFQNEKTGHWYRCSDKAVSWVDGKMVRFEIAADITKSKLIEIELRELSEALKRSNQELEQFAYVASHDLQEPLRMISSYTQLLEKRYSDKLDDDARDFINYAVDGANRMQRLIQDLLTYSRVTTRGQPLQVLDAHDALGEAVFNLNMQIQEASALISNDELPSVKGDKSQIVAVFQNLISNAIKFRKPDVTPRVHISAQKAEGRKGFYTFSVKDNGIGIEEKYFEKLFVIFQRLHGKREYPGTGIGLALVKRIVERHGGKIWLQSTPNEGTTFFFNMPGI